MNTERLLRNITDQIKEAQLKLGFAKEVMRLYYPWESLCRILEIENQEESEQMKELEQKLPELSFSIHQGRVEVKVPVSFVERVHKEVETPEFLADLIELFRVNHHCKLEEIQEVFAKYSRDYVCEKMSQETDFDYVLYFNDTNIDEYYYCIKMEMGHTIYHRFMKADYEPLVEENQFARTELLVGSSAMNRLSNARVAVFGVGGVGGYVAEALARSGVGAIDLIDKDTVSVTNINRQIIALHSTVGRYKTDVMKERIYDINPACKVEVHPCFYLPETKDAFDFTKYSYVVDAVDTVTAKIQLVLQAKEAGTPIISSMGAGNKMNPADFEVTDIYKTSVCPLAKVMRRELKKRGIRKLKVVYSKEQPIISPVLEGEERRVPGSVAFVPSVAGLIIASEVVKDIIAE